MKKAQSSKEPAVLTKDEDGISKKRKLRHDRTTVEQKILKKLHDFPMGENHVGAEMNLFRQVMDPLKIDLILSTVFEFCSGETLKNCRLVNRRWMDVSIRAWRNKATLCIGKRSRNGLEELKEYLMLLQRNEMQVGRYPFKNFSFSHIYTYEYLLKEEVWCAVVRRVILSKGIIGGHLEGFIRRLPMLQTLELENCCWRWDKEKPCPSFNLKRLHIYQSVYCGRMHDYYNPNWEFVLKCCPKLKALAIEYRANRDNIIDIKRYLILAQSIRKEEGEKVLSLKELEVTHVPQFSSQSRNHCKNHEDLVDSIVQSNFPLESLPFHVTWGEADLKKEILPIYQLLDSCKSTLKFLKTSFNVFVNDVTTQLLIRCLKKRKANPLIIRMDAINELVLGNGLWGLHILADLELPSLEKLVMNSGESTTRMDSILNRFQLWFPPDRVYGKLETFEFLDNRNIPGPSTVKSFAKMMPYLVHLTMPLDKFTFKIVCNHLRGLKTLNATAPEHRYMELDDESLTGISKDGGSEGTRSPNITDLALLTDLSIACGTDWSFELRVPKRSLPSSHSKECTVQEKNKGSKILKCE